MPRIWKHRPDPADRTPVAPCGSRLTRPTTSGATSNVRCRPCWGDADRRNARSIWHIPISPYSGAAPGTFPAELVRRCLTGSMSTRRKGSQSLCWGRDNLTGSRRAWSGSYAERPQRGLHKEGSCQDRCSEPTWAIATRCAAPDFPSRHRSLLPRWAGIGSFNQHTDHPVRTPSSIVWSAAQFVSGRFDVQRNERRVPYSTVSPSGMEDFVDLLSSRFRNLL
jgi:hypothetical protein